MDRRRIGGKQGRQRGGDDSNDLHNGYSMYRRQSCGAASSAAAYRYTESRMSRLAVEMLQDIDKETVDFTPNYDDRLKEPTALPSHFPNLLVNGSTGIAVGMATNIPPHNMGEVIDGMCCLIDNPDAGLDELMEHIKGPDFPTAPPQWRPARTVRIPRCSPGTRHSPAGALSRRC